MKEELKKFRKDHDLSRKQLADLLGYSPRTIESIEQGRMELSPVGRKAFESVKRDAR